MSSKEKNKFRRKLLQLSKKELLNRCNRLKIKYTGNESKQQLIDKLLAKQFKKSDKKKKNKKRNRWFKNVSKYGCELKHEYLMHGYLNTFYKSRTFPVDLIILMLTYLGRIIQMRFDITSEQFHLKNNGTLIECNSTRGTLYGCSKGFKTGQHKWHIKCKEMYAGRRSYFASWSGDIVGIISNVKLCKTNRYYDFLTGNAHGFYLYYVNNETKKVGYVVDGVTGCVKCNFNGWRKNDVITVNLNCRKWTVEFKLNNESVCKPINIEKKTYYAIIGSSKQATFNVVY